MKIKGTIRVKGEVSKVSDNFKKRDVVVTTDGEYPQHITVQLTQDKCALIDKYKVGDEIECSIDLRGREYEKDGVTKYFNTVNCWKIEGVNWSEPTKQQAPATQDDGLPF